MPVHSQSVAEYVSQKAPAEIWRRKMDGFDGKMIERDGWA